MLFAVLVLVVVAPKVATGKQCVKLSLTISAYYHILACYMHIYKFIAGASYGAVRMWPGA